MHCRTLRPSIAILSSTIVFLLLTIFPVFASAYSAGSPGFVENRGQWDSRVLYLANAQNGIRWWFTASGPIVEAMSTTVTNSGSIAQETGDPEYTTGTINGHVFPISFLDESNEIIVSTPVGESPQITVSNYLLGNDESKWATYCRHYDRIVYKNVWQGIDVVYRWEENRVKVEYAVAENASPQTIKLGYESLLTLPVVDAASGDLLLQTSVGEIRELQPYSYQIDNGRQLPLPTRYNVSDGIVSFTFPNGYNASIPMVIDPLAFGTFLGGASLDQIEQICTGATAQYVCGYTASSNFPVSAGAYQSNFDGGTYDAFVTKTALDCYSMNYSTYLGGASTDAAYGIIEANSQGEVFIAGESQSSDFLPTGMRGWDTTPNGGYDQFIIRLNAEGSGIVRGTFVGGTSNDRCWAIAKSDHGEPIIVGWTNGLDFPTSASAIQPSRSGGWDATIASFDTNLTVRIGATYLGGTQDDRCYGVAYGARGVYVVGNTMSQTFPLSTNGAQRTYGGTGPYDGGDAFACILSTALDTLYYGTYCGGSSDDYGKAILPTADGFIITGYTFSTNFPITTNACQTTNHGSNDCFMTRYSENGSVVAYSTYYGGGGGDNAFAIAPHDDVSVWIAGNTLSTSYPVSVNAYQSQNRGATDGFLTLLPIDGGAAIYSTYFGGGGNDFISAITDNDGTVTFTGYASSTTFALPNGFQPQNAGGAFDGFICGLAGFSSTKETTQTALPSEVSLSVYPNPWNNAATVTVTLPQSALNSNIALFDVTGREVMSVRNGALPSGTHRFTIDGTKLSSGTYILRFDAEMLEKSIAVQLMK